MRSIVAGLAVLLIHSAALAQQTYYTTTPPPVVPAYPPGYGPPPGYAPPPAYYVSPPPRYVPPPAYYVAPVPVHYPPAAPPRRDPTWRPFTIGIGGGVGSLGFTSESGGRCNDVAGSFTARIGFGLAPRLILLLDVESSALSKNSVDYHQVAELLGLQVFLGNRFFVKGGAGAAQHSMVNGDPLRGGALMGGLGFELIQGWNWSLAGEWTGTVGFYENEETWTNNGLNLVLNFY